MRDIEGRIARLERLRAAEEFDPVKANRIAVECFDAGLPLPDTLTPPERVVAAAICDVLWKFANMWDHSKSLPLESPGHGRSES